jgi:uncharacterized protein YybS (DUF2232 family)
LLVLAAALAAFAAKPSLAGIGEHLGFGEMLLIGLSLGACQYRGWPAHRAIVVTVLALNLVILGFFLAQAFYLGMTPVALLSQKAKEIMELFRQMMARSGLGAQTQSFFGLPEAEVYTLLGQILPGLVLINSALVAWINTVVARQLSLLLGWGEAKPPLFQWYNPEWFIFLALGAGLLLLAPVQIVRIVSLNLLILFAFLYFCQGVAVIAATFHRFQIPWFLRLIGYVILFMNPLFLLVVILGLMDLWLDFRRLQQPLDA